MATIKSHLKIRGSWEMQACNIRFCCYIWLFLPLPTSESNCSRASQSKQKFRIVSRNGRTNGDRCRNATLLIFSLRFFFFFALSRGQKVTEEPQLRPAWTKNPMIFLNFLFACDSYIHGTCKVVQPHGRLLYTYVLENASFLEKK